MTIEHVLAVVPVSDVQRAEAWYRALFGRPPDNRPMPNVVEWQVVDRGWVQVYADTERAGSGLLTSRWRISLRRAPSSRRAVSPAARSTAWARASSCRPRPTPTATPSP